MKDNFFTRDVTRIALGDVVEWDNQGDTLHDAVAADGSWAVPAPVRRRRPRRQRAARAGPVRDGHLRRAGRLRVLLHPPRDAQWRRHVRGPGRSDLEYSPAGDAAPDQPVTDWTGETREVPGRYPSIQNAVDAAEPCDLVLVAPAPEDDAHRATDGRYVYKEQVDVRTPYITIRGTDRNRVVIDGEFERLNGINIAGADGVVELTRFGGHLVSSDHHAAISTVRS